MARYRTLKPETFTDDKLTSLPINVRFLFIGLWCFVDDMGRQAYQPHRIKLEVFPADKDINEQQVDAWMHELDKAELIRIYRIGGKQYFWIPGLLRHQRIDRPTHSYIPQHPKDWKPPCLCLQCKAARNSNNRLPSETPRIVDSINSPIRRLDDSTREVSSGSKEVREVISQNQHLHTHDFDSTPKSIIPSLETSDEDRRARSVVIDEIASAIVHSLEIDSNSLIMQVLHKSIEVVSRVKSCTMEAAAQQIWQRAALVKADSPPDDWAQWFEDARYEYVPQGDSRLQDRHREARPVCGSEGCKDGWERSSVNGHAILRRCQQCVRLWRDEGYSDV